jgi:hypothetical protein
VIGVCLVVGAAAWGQQSVQAHDGANALETFSWTNCTWRWKASTNPSAIRIGWSGGGFPGDSWRTENGVTFKNSFGDRMVDAVGVWNAAFNHAGVPVDLLIVSSSPHIEVHYSSVTDADGGEAWINGDASPGCTVHGTNTHFNIYSADIHIRVRPVANDDFDEDQDWPGWFTQDNARRAVYESCGAPNAILWYTCDKKFDYGSTFVHELGHVVGWLDHPDHVDLRHFDGTDRAWNDAKCDVANDQASLCSARYEDWWPDGPIYRTHRRTLDAWDKTSLTRVVEEWW